MNESKHLRMPQIVKTQRTMLLSSLLLLTISMGILVPQTADCVRSLEETSKADGLKVFPRSGAKETFGEGK